MTKSCSGLRVAALGGTALALVLSAAATAQTTTPTFNDLGDLTGGANESFGTAVSGNGQFFGGRSASTSGTEGFFVMPPSGTITGIGDPPGGTFSSQVNGMSSDGRFLVGTGSTANGNKAFRYDRPAGTFTVINNTLGTSDAGNAISDNGTFVVGTRNNEGSDSAFRWSEADGIQTLTLGAGATDSVANGISADGGFIAGTQEIGGQNRATRWTGTGTPTLLGSLSTGGDSRGNNISSGGETVVGRAGVTGGAHAFRWQQATGMQDLGDFAGGSVFSDAKDVSMNGYVVVGQGAAAAGDRAFIWDEVYGLRDLQDVLTNQYQLGTALSGWTLTDADEITPDGTAIAGTGTVNGNSRAFGVSGLAVNRLIDENETVAANTTMRTGVIVGGSNLTLEQGSTLSVGNGRAYSIAGPTTGPTQYTGTVSGAGTFEKTGPGTFPVAGQFNNSGGFNVLEGSAQLTAANRIGDGVPVAVSSGATLDLNGFDDTVASLSGAGALSLGAGRLTLAGGSGASQTYSGVASGTGGVTVSGGTHTFSGNSTYTGETRVTGGMLVVNGELVGQVLLQGGRLGGTGRFGSLTNSGGILGPGNSIGVLVLNGNFSQGANGTLEIEIAPDGRADLLRVLGSASLGGTLLLIPEAGTYSAGTRYVVIEAQSISGSFGTVTTQDSAKVLGNLTPTVTQEGTRIIVTLAAPTIASSGPSSASIQEQAIEEVQIEQTRARVNVVSRAIGNKLRRQFLQSGSGTFRPGGGTQQSAGSGGLAGGDEGMMNLDGWSVWTDASWIGLDSDRERQPYNGDQQIALFGLDHLVTEQLVVGGVLGVDNTELEFKTDNGEQEAVAGSLTLYAGYALNEWFTLDARAGYGYAHNETERFPTPAVYAEGEFSSHRANVGINGNLILTEDRMQMVASLGFSFGWEGFEDYTSSDGARVDPDPSRLGLITLTGEASYAFDSVVPFVAVQAGYDAVTTDHGADRAALTLGVGASFPITERLNAGVQVYTDVSRDDDSMTELGANLRYTF